MIHKSNSSRWPCQAELPVFFWACWGAPAKKIGLGTRRFPVASPLAWRFLVSFGHKIIIEPHFNSKFIIFKENLSFVSNNSTEKLLQIV